ncbi:TRAP transporter small permease [Aquabacter spiritensis]|uniref:TRAP transporter small permease protein n=1 Tax=Aquabacter spiritensis TaxID=933073 RepID=A0A4R3M019_9HYPH|nr:TRAP transporter small permease [Aquabacter spiritensis]TCT06053.1 TRAP-type C4-dicarboxylate transport system permease small subunit [Aquabacter spiritensis]
MPPSPEDTRFGVAPRLVVRLSEGLLKAEKIAVAGFLMLLTGLILLNVATRYTGMPLYWVDEAAIYAVVWLTFVGASAMTRLRLDFSVTLLTERLSPAMARRAKVVSTLLLIAFGLALAAMCWLWMDPVGIAAAGFDAREHAGQTFNFLYTEVTQTLRWPTWLISLVMPLFAVSLVIHGLANLLEDLGLARMPARAATLAAPEGVS